jgi:hypothetical protein
MSTAINTSAITGKEFFITSYDNSSCLDIAYLPYLIQNVCREKHYMHSSTFFELKAVHDKQDNEVYQIVY